MPERSVRRALALAAAGVALMAGAPVASAQQAANPFLAPPTTTTATPTVSQTTAQQTGSSGGISNGVLIPSIVAGVLLLLAIAYFIVRDARRAAPVAARPATATPRDGPSRIRRERARAKAARRARKRNR